jgi:hypothetical protein
MINEIAIYFLVKSFQSNYDMVFHFKFKNINLKRCKTLSLSLMQKKVMVIFQAFESHF